MTAQIPWKSWIKDLTWAGAGTSCVELSENPLSLSLLENLENNLHDWRVQGTQAATELPYMTLNR